MAHLPLSDRLPGILGLFEFRPETAKPLSELAQVLLRGESSLTPGERELIASHVSYLNQCHFCHHSHRAAAIALLESQAPLVDEIKADPEASRLSEKMKALLRIASKVQREAKSVSSADIERATAAGATALEIHDTVLISAAFCMFNRYVDGLGTWAPEEESAYRRIGEQLAKDGYR